MPCIYVVSSTILKPSVHVIRAITKVSIFPVVGPNSFFWLEWLHICKLWMVFSLFHQIGHYYVFLHANDGGFSRLAWWDSKRCYLIDVGCCSRVLQQCSTCLWWSSLYVAYRPCHLNVPRCAFPKSLKSILQSWILFLDTENIVIQEKLASLCKSNHHHYVCVCKHMGETLSWRHQHIWEFDVLSSTPVCLQNLDHLCLWTNLIFYA